LLLIINKKMSTCTNCYNTNSAAPCGSVGCLSTNYSKCILYSGNNLYCQTGAIQTINYSGVAVSPVADVTVTVSATGGTGSGATFSVTRKAGYTTYLVSLVNPGLGYTVGDVLTLAGSSLGGGSGNNILVIVASLVPIINSGDDLDKVILNLNQRICLASTSGLDYSTFNYSCLRVGGSLTGVGTAITTAQTFTEATAAALCALNTRVVAVEKPALTVPSCFSGTITSGTTGLASILTQYGAMLCAHNTNLDLSAVTSNPCGSYSFTSKPTSNNVKEYIDWITTNMCGMFTTQSALITTQTNKVNALYTYITGTTSGSVPTSIDTSCLSGGSSTSSLKDAIVLIKNNLCSLNTTVTGLVNPTSTLSWGVFTSAGNCGGTFNNSPYSGLSAIASTNTLSNHLNNIIAVLASLRMGFSTEFAVTPSSNACGAFSNISLKTGNVNDLLAYEPGGWVNKAFNVTINGSSTGVVKTVIPGAGNAYNVDLTIPTSTVSVGILTSAITAPLSIVPSPLNSFSKLPELVKTGNTVQIQQGSIFRITASSSFNFASSQVLTLFNIPVGYTLPPVGVSPAGTLHAPVHITLYNTSNVIIGTYPAILEISLATITIKNIHSATITIGTTDYLQIAIGGISWYGI
jgi:hypothetical protein